MSKSATAKTNVVLVDAVRTPFGKAGSLYAGTRADDIMVRCIRGLLERNPNLPVDQIDDVAIAAATQTGDQGMNIGRSVSILAGIPKSVPGYSIDRWCAGALTAVTTIAGGINMGAYDLAIAGGVEHMGNHPMGDGIDPNPRYLAERIVDNDALQMGATAERLHDKFPHLTKDRADKYALASQQKTAAAYAANKIQPDLIPVATRTVELGWGVATVDEPPRPQTTLEALGALKTPFRAAGRVTAGNAAGLNDGATAATPLESDRNPSPSVVVAPTETLAPTTSLKRASSSLRLGPIFGLSAMTCTATFSTENPLAAISLRVSEIKTSPLAPANSGRSTPKLDPISPRPAADSMASTIA